MFMNEKDLDKTGENSEVRIVHDHTFIVLDWDDTLLPTTWLAQNFLSLDTLFIPEKIRSRLESLDAKVSALLRKMSVLHGQVLLITNAQPQWVELSSEKFLPETHRVLFPPDLDSTESVCSFVSCSDILNIPSMAVDEREGGEEAVFGVFSSRLLFEKDFPCNPSAWKQMAFRKLLEIRVDQKFLSKATVKSLSDSKAAVQMTSPEETEKQKRGLKRSLSELSFCTSDVSGLVEVEGSSYEVETEFKETDSYFSLNFSLPSIKGDLVNDGTSSDEEAEETSCSTSRFSPKRRKLHNQKQQLEACNLISIGDCFHDCDSLKHLDIGLDQRRSFKKTVKFVSYPSVETLIAEVEGLASSIDRIVSLRKDINLVVAKKKVTAEDLP